MPVHSREEAHAHLWPLHSAYARSQYLVFGQMNKSVKTSPSPVMVQFYVDFLFSTWLLLLLSAVFHSALIVVHCLHGLPPPPRPNVFLPQVLTAAPLAVCLFLDLTEAAPAPGPLYVLLPPLSRSASECTQGSFSPFVTCHLTERLP